VEGEIVGIRKRTNSSKIAFRVVLDWLFKGAEVYRLSEPDRILTTLKINWDAQTSDLQDADGTVFRHIPWTDVEFLHPEDYHLAGED